MSIKSEKKPLILSCSPAISASDPICVTVTDTDGMWYGEGEPVPREAAAVYAALSFSAGYPELLTANLKALGFDRLSVALSDDSPYHAGISFGMKRVGDDTLVIAVLSGTQGAQWYSNFRVGFRQEHRGFAIAADYAERRLYDYLDVHAGGSVRFMLTGYSRGGAAANILARRLCDCRGTDRVRCVTFASPNTTMPYRGASYDVIRNYIRGEDFFTRVPPAGWGYVRYGRTVTLGGDISEGFRRLTGREYIGFSRSSQVDAVISAMNLLAPNAHAYYKRRYPVGGRMLSLYDYMTGVAALLAEDDDGLAGEMMLDSFASEFADLTAFLSSGMDIAELLSPAAGIPRCSVGDSHSPAAYMAALTDNSYQITDNSCGRDTRTRL